MGMNLDVDVYGGILLFNLEVVCVVLVVCVRIFWYGCWCVHKHLLNYFNSLIGKFQFTSCVHRIIYVV